MQNYLLNKIEFLFICDFPTKEILAKLNLIDKLFRINNT